MQCHDIVQDTTATIYPRQQSGYIEREKNKRKTQEENEKNGELKKKINTPEK